VRSRRGKTGSFRTRIEVMNDQPRPAVEFGGIRDALITRAAAHLSGDLKHFGLPTLLALAEVEQLTGVLSLVGAERTEAVYLRRGRVVSVTGKAPDEPTKRLAALCRWKTGSFSLVLRRVDRADEIGKPTTAFLIDLAREDDEAKRVA
jgi:hypothetical protein